MQVSVVVVSFKDSPDTKECVMSVLKAAGNFKIDVITVWNDGHGYAEGANKGIQQGLANGADYICLLNNDTKVDPQFLKEMLKADVDLCGAKIYDWDTTRMQAYSCKMNMWMGQPSYTPRLDSSPTDNGQFNNVKDIQWFSGCCTLIKRSVFENIGLLDESYIAYFEDVDFCIRARKVGFSLGLAPAAYVWHKGGRSTSSEFKTRMVTRNRIRFMRKHATKLQFMTFCLYYFGFYLWASLLYHSIYSPDYSNEMAIWVGIYEGLGGKR